MPEEAKDESSATPEQTPAEVTFSDMVSLDPPPVPSGFDDSTWHAEAAQPSRSQVIKGLAEKLDDRYKRTGELGHGGMATVFDSVDMSLRRHVAVKVIHPKHLRESGSDDERSAIQRFVDEAQITAQLEHPNIIPVHEIGVDDDGQAFFTMKRVEGRSLRDVFDDMRAGKAGVLDHYSSHQCVEVLLKICDAMAFAHSRDVIHRDLKPDNVMVGRFGEVQVMDWGLAKILSTMATNLPDTSQETFTGRISVHSDDATHTLEGTISGTPAYMPPEQANGRVSEVDERSDVFLLGALLYEMLTLVPPYHAESSMAALRRAQRYDIPSVAAMAARIASNPELEDDTILHPLAVKRAQTAPRELAAIAQKALAEDPKNRYPNVEAMIADIERYRRGEPVTAYRDPFLRSVGKWISRHRVVSFAAAGMFLTAMIASIIILAIEKDNSDNRLADAQEQSMLNEEIAQLEIGKRELEQENQQREREAQEKERAADQARIKALLKRREARVLLDEANDLLARAAGGGEGSMRAALRKEALENLNQALLIDSDFGRAYIVRGQTHLRLGNLQLALEDLLEGNHIQRELEKLREDPALLMTIAMIALAEGQVLGHANLETVYVSALKRISDPSNENGPYRSLALLLLNEHRLSIRYEREHRAREKAKIILEFQELIDQVAMLQSDDNKLWEVHLFVGALRINQAASRVGDAERARALLERAKLDLQRALTLQPQLPVVVAFQTKANRLLAANGGENAPALSDLSKPWEDYIDTFPEDPMGYFALARLHLQDLQPSSSEFAKREATLDKASTLLHKALNENSLFSEARDMLGLIAEMRGDHEVAYEEYVAAFEGWSPLLELPPQDPYHQPIQMSLMERYVRLSVRLDAKAAIRERASRTIDLLRRIYEKCEKDTDNPASWSSFQHAEEVYRYAFKVALDEAVRFGADDILHQMAEQSFVSNPQEEDYLAIAQAMIRVGDFEYGQRFLGEVHFSSNKRRSLEDEMNRFRSALKSQPLDLNPEESLLLSRMQSKRGKTSEDIDRDRILGTLWATRLASTEELKTTLQALSQRDKMLTNVIAEQDEDRTITKIFPYYLALDPLGAKVLAKEINYAKHHERFINQRK